MAFEATRNYRSIEIRNAVAVPRTVYPANLPPVRDGQLKKQIALPEQESLPLPSRADHQTEALGAGTYIGFHSLHGRLEETVVVCLHAEKQIGIRSLENVVARTEIAKN